MTIPNGPPFNVAGDRLPGRRASGQHVDVIVPGDVQVTVGQDASPEAKYQAGVANLKQPQPGAGTRADLGRHDGREAIGNRLTSEVLFHWLVAMLSGRTVRQFTGAGDRPTAAFRSRCTRTRAMHWADGVRLIYRLLDSALPSPERRGEAEDQHVAPDRVSSTASGKSSANMLRPHRAFP